MEVQPSAVNDPTDSPRFLINPNFKNHMSTATEHSTLYLQSFIPKAGDIFSIDDAARISGMPRHILLVCCRNRLVAPWTDPQEGGYFFDASAIQTLRRIEYLRTECAVNWTGIHIILHLAKKLENLGNKNPLASADVF